MSIARGASHWTDVLGLTDCDVFPEVLAGACYRLVKQVYGGHAMAKEVQAIEAVKGGSFAAGRESAMRPAVVLAEAAIRCLSGPLGQIGLDPGLHRDEEGRGPVIAEDPSRLRSGMSEGKGVDMNADPPACRVLVGPDSSGR